jgi:hypothetical protein
MPVYRFIDMGPHAEYFSIDVYGGSDILSFVNRLPNHCSPAIECLGWLGFVCLESYVTDKKWRESFYNAGTHHRSAMHILCGRFDGLTPVLVVQNPTWYILDACTCILILGAHKRYRGKFTLKCIVPARMALITFWPLQLVFVFVSNESGFNHFNYIHY